jgi:pimeloyl-ACP methyl ester carboxylesterase
MAQVARSAREISLSIPPAGTVGDLAIPQNAKGLVLFAHGSGSSRFSPRNRFVAGLLRSAGFATLLLDLLTGPEEEVDQQTRQLRFDIDLLAERLVQATGYIGTLPDTSALAAGYFGASTGAAAALVAAAELSGRIKAVVSRGGRPDLAGAALPRVKAPTLLIVGGADEPVVELNRQALADLTCEKKLEIIPGATHLFKEVGTLENVTSVTVGWFHRYLT